MCSTSKDDVQYQGKRGKDIQLVAEALASVSDRADALGCRKLKL